MLRSAAGGRAEKGELAVMVGADDEAYELVKPVFKQWASMVVRAGEPGAGTRMKLARNMLTYIGFAAACEASKLAEAAGIEPAEARPGRAAQRRPERRPGAIMVRDDTKPLTPDHFLHDMFVHTRGLATRTSGWRSPSARPRRGPAARRDRAAGPGGGPRCAAHEDEGVIMDELRRKGLEKMNEVYGWEMPNMAGDTTST